MADADVSCTVGTIGLVVPFVVTDGGYPISNAISAIVTWLAQDGKQRPLTLNTPVSAEFIYIMSAWDTRAPHREEGYLRVSYDTNTFYTSFFTVSINPHFG